MSTDNDKKTLDYGAFLSDLEAKRAVLDQAIASLKAVMAAGSTEGMSSVNLGATLANPVIHGGEVPAGAFHGMSIPAAAKLYLSIVKKKQTTKEIADGLREGGMETSGKNFEVIVGSGLYRISRGSSPEVVRVKGAWGLAEWWPAGVGSAQGKPNGRKAKKARKQRSAKASAADPHVSGGILGKDGHIRFPRDGSTESNGHKTTRDRVADLLQSNPENVYTPRDVSKVLNIEVGFAGLTLGKLAAKKVAEKIEAGKYRAAHG